MCMHPTSSLSIMAAGDEHVFDVYLTTNLPPKVQNAEQDPLDRLAKIILMAAQSGVWEIKGKDYTLICDVSIITSYSS